MAEKRKRKDAVEETEQYASRLYHTGKRGKEISHKARDIGEIPDVVDPDRRIQGASSFEFFCRTYLPETFYLPWSLNHRKVIAQVERGMYESDLFAYAMPRGSGKTALSQAATLWSILYGYRSFGAIIGATEPSAVDNLMSIKRELETNERIGGDFPEACYPIRKLEGIANRAGGQLYHDERTYIEWRADRIVFPTIAGSVSSGSVIGVAGITGHIRGLQFKHPTGRMMRPDFVILDDPQTDESAASPSQNDQRVRLILRTILGLSGPGKPMCVLMPCTVIAPNDIAAQLTDPKLNPEWHGERSGMVLTWPTDMQLWDRYRTLRDDSLRAGNRGAEATDFYQANREAMDKGSAVSWPDRHDKDEISGIQHAMNWLYKIGKFAFFAEFQNDPIPEMSTDADALVALEVAAKVNKWPRGVLPLQATRLSAFIDVQKNVLFWLVLATGEKFDGWIVDYGVFPEQHREYFTLGDCKQTLQLLTKESSVEASIRSGLELLVAQLSGREWKRSDGTVFHIEQGLIDSAWGEMTEVVYEFCRASAYSSAWKASRGMFVGASSRQFSEYRRQEGDKIGLNWRIPSSKGKRVSRLVLYDANWWKSFVASRLKVSMGASGCFSLFGSEPNEHRLFADHLVSEEGIKTDAKGRSVVEWKWRMHRPDNHWWDCLTGSTVAASMLGATLGEGFQATRPKRSYIDYAALVRAKQRV